MKIISTVTLENVDLNIFELQKSILSGLASNHKGVLSETSVEAIQLLSKAFDAARVTTKVCSSDANLVKREES